MDNVTIVKLMALKPLTAMAMVASKPSLLPSEPPKPQDSIYSQLANGEEIPQDLQTSPGYRNAYNKFIQASKSDNNLFKKLHPNNRRP